MQIARKQSLNLVFNTTFYTSFQPGNVCIREVAACISHLYSLAILMLVGQVKGHSAKAEEKILANLRLVLPLEIYMSATWISLPLLNTRATM